MEKYIYLYYKRHNLWNVDSATRNTLSVGNDKNSFFNEKDLF